MFPRILASNRPFRTADYDGGYVLSTQSTMVGLDSTAGSKVGDTMFQKSLREQRGPVAARRIKAEAVLALLVFVAAPLLVLQHTSIRAFHLSPSTTTSPSVVDEFDWYSVGQIPLLKLS